ncbi:hypothetical protein M0R45_005124 [Rubus argutus]|uniref:Uncharacterized protein n=1 Tax=Rubus argutus TaxID=59490 RepID=A0AAW1YLU5_RUBAR
MAMIPLRNIFFSSPVLLLIIVTRSVAQPDFQHYWCYDDKGNYTADSPYQTNLNTLLSSLLSTNGNGYGFYNSSYAENSNDRAYATGFCRGDVVADDCRSCLNDSTHQLRKVCPNRIEALGFYPYCMLRYSNRPLYGFVDDSVKFYAKSLTNVSSSEVEGFFQVLRTLLERLRNEAAEGGSLRKFAVDNTSTQAFRYIYALSQCTPDLSKDNCSSCLVGAFVDINYSYGSVAGSVVKPNCDIRYDVSPFYDSEKVAPLPSSPPISPPSPPISPSSPPSRPNKWRNVIIIVVTITVFLVLSLCVCISLRVRRKTKKLDQSKLADAEDTDATGSGGFGSVYRGKLSNGQEIAVKRLSMNSGQGDLEFKNEVLLVARLQHRNLVRLLGFCLERNERLLVYEFVPNASLDHIIFDPTKRSQLDWDKRYKIILGIARGLLYLHEDSRLRIIHRDLKASNILIDAALNAKISDFGMAWLFELDQTHGSASRIVGTYGYMAPEYAMHGHFSIKSDVYSFGCIDFGDSKWTENSCFRNGENVEYLPSYAWKNWREGTVSNLTDPTLTSGLRTEMMRCIHIGLLCVQENMDDRPTMASVILMLNSYSVTLPAPSEPAFFMHSSSGVITSKSNFVSVKVPENESALITEVYPR